MTSWKRLKKLVFICPDLELAQFKSYWGGHFSEAFIGKRFSCCCLKTIDNSWHKLNTWEERPENEMSIKALKISHTFLESRMLCMLRNDLRRS